PTLTNRALTAHARAEDIGCFATQMPMSTLAGQPCVETTLQAADTSPSKREVAGSNPAAPTNRRVAQRIERLRLCCPSLARLHSGYRGPEVDAAVRGYFGMSLVRIHPPASVGESPRPTLARPRDGDPRKT